MAREKLRVGVIGAVWGERAHVPAVKALPEMELAAVCTAHPDTAQAYAQRVGAPKAYSDVAQLVRDPEIDVVTVAARVSLHHAMVQQALSAGKHIYCEWPLAASLAQAVELAELAQRRRSQVVGVGLQGRWSPINRFARRLIQEESLGELLTFSMSSFSSGFLQPMPSQRSWLAAEEEQGSALSITGGHSLDTLCWLVGYPVELTASVETRVRQITWSDTKETAPVTAPDTVAATLRFKNGAVGTVTISRVAWHGSGYRLELFGSKGSLHLVRGASAHHPGPVLLLGKGAGGLVELPVPEEYFGVSGVARDAQHLHVAHSFRQLARSVRTGEPMEPSLADGLRLHHLLAAIELASQEKRWVPAGVQS